MDVIKAFGCGLGISCALVADKTNDSIVWILSKIP
jgi:hypothetical protein